MTSPSTSHSPPGTGKARRGATGGSSGQGHGMPSSGSASTRQRSAIACRYCRRRKIRCYGFDANPADPRCSNCIKFGQPCIFTPVSAMVGVPTGDYASIGNTMSRDDGLPMYQSPQSNTHYSAPHYWPDLHQQHQQHQIPNIASAHPTPVALAPPLTQSKSHSLYVAPPPSFQDLSSTGQSLLPPVLFPSDFPRRQYSTTDPTHYRHSTVRRPGSEVQGVPYHSPPNRTHRLSSISSISSDPGVLVSSPPLAPSVTSILHQAPSYIVLPSPPALSQAVRGSPTSSFDRKVEPSKSPESPRQFGQPVELAEYFHQRPQVSTSSTFSEPPSTRIAYQQQSTPPSRPFAEVPQLDMGQNVASSRASISNLLDPTGETPSSELPGTDRRGLQRSSRSDRR
ncbi:hypothetical protein V1525DRAFT_7981 [Lipomyces kononenkoae]|uniref:Uncharacterized protein n=1 Tax=Lipomyces kononenkoae TaxID=34357 RepID=A0ACC3TCI1_LIPKO